MMGVISSALESSPGQRIQGRLVEVDVTPRGRPKRSPRGAPNAGRVRRVDVGGYRLWMKVSGSGSPTVLFESGGGDHSAVWGKVEPEVRKRKKVTTVLYDRAGLGRSERKPGPYRIDDEVAAVRAALTACGVGGPIVLVAHSYGGFVSLLMAEEDPRVAGLVLVDANLPGFFDDAEVSRLLDRVKPTLPEMARAAPKIGKVMVPLTLAMPETARRMRWVATRARLPIVDILAERTWVPTPEEVAAMRREHAAFVAASPHREMVFAKGSGHYVMRDRPKVVIEAISRLIDRIPRTTTVPSGPRAPR
jgi:pimeloyl-ACP methyl ester carboxylesterase